MTAKTERADAMRWIQAQMDDYGLTLEELDGGVLRAAASTRATPSAAGGLLSQRGRADLGRAG